PVNSGGTLGGTGTIGGPVTVNSGGFLAPGISPGIVNTGSLALSSGSTFTVEFNSPYATAGTDYDQVNVTGTVALNGATLNLVGGAVAPSGNVTMTLIRNDSNDAVSGNFAGLSNLSTVTVGAFSGLINYAGGDGNDVVLTNNQAPVITTQP